MSHGAAGYTTAKHGVIGLMRYYATSLAEKSIRVNTVHPSGVATRMIVNEPTQEFTAAHPEFVASQQNLLPVALIEPESISDTMVYLCAPSGRYIMGVTLPVDAGLVVR